MESLTVDEEILRNPNLVFVDEISSEYKCSICKKIIYNAYTTPCAHEYCKSCIGNYLVSCNKKCVVNESECQRQDLQMNVNVFPCPRTNKFIGNIKIKCVNDCCDLIMKVKDAREHLNSCLYKPENCPYTYIGCSSSMMAMKDVKKHLIDEAITHANLSSETIKRMYDLINEQKEEMNNIVVKFNEENELLRNSNVTLSGRIESIETTNSVIMENVNIEISALKQEISNMKEKNNKMSIEMKKLKEDLKIKDEKIAKIIEEINNLKDANLRKTKEVEGLKKKNECVEDEMKKLKEDVKLKDEKIAKITEEINNLKDENLRKTKEIEGLKKKNENVEDEMKDLREEIREIKKRMENEKKENKKEIEITKEMTENLKKSIICPLVPAQYNVKEVEVDIGDFVNKIESIKKDDEVKEIDKFDRYLNGYKICFKLSVRRDIGTYYHVSIKLSVCEGEFDNLLSWPCKRRIEVELIERDGGRGEEAIFDYKEDDKWRNKVVGERGEDSEERWIIGGIIGSSLEDFENEILINNSLKIKIKII